MKIQSDKSIKIFNQVKILFIDQSHSKIFESLCLELFKNYQNKKIVWYFYSKKISLKNFSENVIKEANGNQSFFIIFSDGLSKIQLDYLKQIFFIHGKKILIFSKKRNKQNFNEFIFNEKITKLEIKLVKNKIIDAITKI